MSYYIGIDGGGTSTIVCVTNALGEVHRTIKVGPTNYHSIGINGVKENLKQALDSLNENENIGLNDIKSICFGGAGVDSPKCKETIVNIFIELGYKNKLQVYNDSVIALVGANGGYHGGVIASGTGSVALGIDKDSVLHKVGGWGHILDDRGSGYIIGRDALTKVMENYDGREKETLLWKSISEKLNISNQEEIINFVYNSKTQKQDIADLATLVIDISGKDEVAKQIVDRTIESLEIMIKALVKRIQKDDFSLGLYGSILTKNEIIRNKLTENIKLEYPKVDIHLPYKEAYIGAVDLAIGKVKI